MSSVQLSRRALGALSLVLCAPALHAEPAAAAPIAPELLLQDLEALQQAIARTHPDVGFSVEPARLQQAYAALAAELKKGPLTRRQAWLQFARLNPVFADAHLFVNLPDREALVKAHLQAGGGLFPFEVQVNPAGELFVRSLLGGGATPWAGTQILRVNGRDAKALTAELLTLMHGDTPAFRAEVLSMRWYLPYWLAQGAPERFELVLEGAPQPLVLPAGRALPQHLQDEVFEQTYRLQLLPEKSAALLTLGSFYWPDKPRFHAFVEDAYAKLKAAEVKHLIIDIRNNGGGDDDLWKGPLLRLLADKPFRNGSDYIKKVIAGRASGSEKVGDVVSGQIDTWVQPDLENPLRFKGQVYVLVGRFTYSSAVLFSNVVQDFGVGQLVGAGGIQRTRQSGGIQSITLPHTGLTLIAPRFVLTRPSGQREPELLRPDIVLPDDPFEPMALVRALLARPWGRSGGG